MFSRLIDAPQEYLAVVASTDELLRVLRVPVEETFLLVDVVALHNLRLIDIKQLNQRVDTGEHNVLV